jgi:hypothetical protein
MLGRARASNCPCRNLQTPPTRCGVFALTWPAYILVSTVFSRSGPVTAFARCPRPNTGKQWIDPPPLSVNSSRPTTTKRSPATDSATYAVADVSGLWGVDHSQDLQLHSGRQHLELSTPPTEQDRDLVNL